jgi:choline dehydrogenase
MDGWANLGNPAWAYDRLLPLLRRLESDQEFRDSPSHGAAGPLHIHRQHSFDGPLPVSVRALINRAQDRGLPKCPDMNGPEPLGICLCPSTTKAGRRQSTRVAYLDPARRRPNLTIVDEAMATKLLFTGCRAVGVDYLRGGSAHAVRGARIVVSTGVYHTPQLLMLSGVGPPRELERLGIRVIHGLEGVGGTIRTTLSWSWGLCNHRSSSPNGRCRGSDAF